MIKYVKRKQHIFFLFLLFFVVVCFAILEHFESSHLIKGKKINMEQTIEKKIHRFYLIFQPHFTISTKT